MLAKLQNSGFECIHSLTDQYYTVKKYFETLISSVALPQIESVGELFCSLKRTCSSLLGRVANLTLFYSSIDGSKEEEQALLKTKEAAEKVLLAQEAEKKATEELRAKAAQATLEDKSLAVPSESTGFSLRNSFGKFAERFQNFFSRSTDSREIPWQTSSSEGKAPERS